MDRRKGFQDVMYVAGIKEAAWSPAEAQRLRAHELRRTYDLSGRNTNQVNIVHPDILDAGESGGIRRIVSQAKPGHANTPPTIATPDLRASSLIDYFSAGELSPASLRKLMSAIAG